jgi:pimeloyl-ACP methyl ester carboxylesterase
MNPTPAIRAASSAAQCNPAQSSPAAPSAAQPALFALPPALHLGLGAWVSVPAQIDPQAPVLVAVHGIGRAARSQAQAFMQRAAQQGRMVVAPRFEASRWPNYQRLGRSGQRADVALLSLLESIGFQWRVNTRRIALFGYSGGAQFAHRFALLHPHRVQNLCICASGWYAWPDEQPLLPARPVRPAKLGAIGPNSALSEQRMSRFLQLPIEVVVGAKDCVRDQNTRSTPLIDAVQGPDRLTRARRWVSALQAAAQARDLLAPARLTVLPGAGHDFQQCLAHGRLLELALPSPDGQARAHASDPARAHSHNLRAA